MISIRHPVVRYGAYSAFFFFCLLISFYLTFPWDSVKDRIFTLIERETKIKVTAKKISPHWFTGLKATEVEITPNREKDPIKLDWLIARAKPLAFLMRGQGVSVSSEIGKGTVDASVVMLKKSLDVDTQIHEVHLDAVPGLAAAGFPMKGTLTAEIELAIDNDDPKKTSGNLHLKASGFVLDKGFKVSMFPLPRSVDFGSFDIKVPIKEAKADLKGIKLHGEDVELTLDGNIVLAAPFDRSMLNLTIGFKPTPALLTSDPMIKSLLQNIERAKGSDGYYTYSATGPIKSPQFRPARR